MSLQTISSIIGCLAKELSRPSRFPRGPVQHRIAVALAVWAISGSPVLADLGVPIGSPSPVNTNASTDSGNDGSPRILTDRAGTWLAVWVSSDDLGGTIGTDLDLLLARSTDNGASWSAPQPLSSTAADAGGLGPMEDGAPELATDGLSTWLVVWESSEEIDAIGSDMDILVARSTDNGATWSTPVALNTNANSDGGADKTPHLATDGLGRWVAVWASFDSLNSTIFFDADILVAYSTNDGLTWSAPAPLNVNAHVDGNAADRAPRIATDGLGTWVAVWESENDLDDSIGTDTDLLYARSTDGGETWTAPAVLNSDAATDVGHDLGPQLAVERTRDIWIAMWSAADLADFVNGPDGDIFCSKSIDGGVSWSPVATVNANAGSDSGGDLRPHLTVDGAGGWVAAWESGDSLGGTIGTDTDVLVARSDDDGTTWTFPEPLNTNAGSDMGEDVTPRLATDSAGNHIAVWASNETFGGTLGFDYDVLSAMFIVPLPSCFDLDGDGYGAPGDVRCPGGAAEDCDNLDPAVYPGAVQVCDGINNDCMHSSWPALDGTNEADNDRDGLSTCGGDCDDTNPEVWGTPGEVRDLVVYQFADSTVLAWLDPLALGGTAVAYDVIGSSNPSDFMTDAYCVAVDSDQHLAIDSIVELAPGGVIVYLTRAENQCPAVGTVGFSSIGTERLARSCP